MKAKHWLCITLGLTAGLVLMAGGLVAVVDPFFHYHKPLPGLSYIMDNERYQNNGILRNFDYNAIITGTSVTENFKSSQFDRLFGVRSVKVPFGGGSFKEVDQAVRTGLSARPQVRCVLRSLDGQYLLTDKDTWDEKAPRPAYLYDANPFNDVNYLLNKEVLFGNVRAVLKRTGEGLASMNFDEYMNWSPQKEWGLEAVLRTYQRAPQSADILAFTQEDRQMVKENLEQNVLSTARAYPQVTFYYFIPPYSICYWDDELNRRGRLMRAIDAEAYAIELMLSCDNIRLFSFSDKFDLVCDMSHYMDVIHYSQDVNEAILEWMARDQHRLTKDNYEEYIRKIREFYSSYDYDSLYPDNGS